MPELGEVPLANCTAFLSNLEEWEDDIGVVYGSNNQQAKAMLIPIQNVLSSSTILRLIECKL